MRLIRIGAVAMFLVSAFCSQAVAQDEPAAGNNEAKAANLVEALSSRFFEKRRNARIELQAMGQTAVQPLLKALENETSSVRSSAALVLGRMKIRDALPELLRLVEDPSMEVRSKAVEALGEVGTDAVDLLRAHLKDAQGRRREVLEELLGRALQSAVDEYLNKTMIAPDKCLYCPGPVEDLRGLGGAALKALESLADWTQHGTTGYYALNAIGDLGDPAGKDFLKKKYEEAKVSGALVYRAGAAMALSKLGEPSYAQEIIRDIELGVYATSGPGKHSSLGATYLEIGKLDDAEREFLEAKKLQPQETSYVFRLGCVYGLRGNAEKAVGFLKEAVEKGFVKASVLQHVGYFSKIRESEEWKKFIEEALKKEKSESLEEDKENGEAKEQ